MKKILFTVAALLIAVPSFAMLHNLTWKWGNPPRCSPPQTPMFAFYNRENTTMMFDKGDEIEIYCQAGIRTGSGMTWSLHRNMVVEPFAKGEAEDYPANLFRIKIRTKDLIPGFYDLKVRLEGLGHSEICLEYNERAKKPRKSPPVGQCTFGWKADEMALPSYRPADFRKFWDNAYGNYRKIPLAAKVESAEMTFDAKAVETYNVTNACLPPCFDPKGMKYDEVVSYKVSWAGPDGGRVYAWLARPKAPGRYPAMLVLPGAGTGPRPRPLDHARHGYVAIDVQVHGFDAEVEKSVKLPGYNGIPPVIFNPITDYCWYKIYLRAARAVDYLCSLDFVDSSKIVTCGGSQGGRLSIAVPAIDNRVAATIPGIAHGANIPYLSFFKTCNGEKLRKNPDTDEYTRDPAIKRVSGMDLKDAPPVTDSEYFKCSAYFDPMNFAPDVKCPVLMNMGLLDPCSFATGVYSAYLSLGSENKKIVPVAGHAHDWFPAFDRLAYRWLDEVLK